MGLRILRTVGRIVAIVAIALLLLYLYIALSGPVMGGPGHGTPGQEQGCLWIFGIGGCLP
jgi:hypothetical protein